MTFFKRLRIYLIGVGLGLVLTFFMFRERGCEWTPENRVLQMISTSQILVSDSVRCVMKANDISDADIFDLIQKGDVLFSESITDSVPRVYVLQGKSQAGSDFKIMFSIQKDTALASIIGVPEGKRGSCANLSSISDKIFTMPESTVKSILKTNEISTSDSIRAILEKEKINDGQIYNMIEGGKIIFEESYPLKKPHPVYTVKSGKYIFEIEMTDKKTRILSVEKSD